LHGDDRPKTSRAGAAAAFSTPVYGAIVDYTTVVDREQNDSRPNTCVYS